MLERVGQYEVVGQLASDAGREVWLAKSPSGQPVAIAKLPRAVRRGSTARHPNLVEVLELVQVGDDLYRIMEYLEGESLAGLIRRLIKKRERIAFGLAAHMIAEVCDGLNAAHLAGELHRAVSPETVFLTYGGDIKVLELGVVLADPDSVYRSPEQAGNQPLGRQSDVYSTGLVLYELTTLRRVFGRPSQLMLPIPAPSTQVDGYPDKLDAICMGALARDPGDRFRSSLEMRDELIAYASGPDSIGDPTQSLASKLMRLFGDRIAAKRALLDRVRVGIPPGDVVTTEASDLEIEVPPIRREGRGTVEMLSERPSPIVVRSAKIERAVTTDGEAEIDDELVTSRPWLRTQDVEAAAPVADSGELVDVLLPIPVRAPPERSAPQRASSPPVRPVFPAAPSGTRWGVLLLFVLAIAAGGAAGAWLRLYY